MIDEAQAAQLPLLVWDANEDFEIRGLLGEQSVVGVITDRPRRALELRALAGRLPL